MSNADVILNAIVHSDGLTDAELVRRTDIRPHQQVNQICHKLVARGLIARRPGPGGQLVNTASSANGHSMPREPSVRQSHAPAVGKPADDGALGSVSQLDLSTTLLVIPCSAGKNPGGTAERGVGLCDVLPKQQADRLRRARLAVHHRAGIDERHVMPAWQRYSGTFFGAASTDLGEAVANDANIVILSGGYGAVLATEPIGTYEARFKVSWWPDNVVAHAVAAYALGRGLRTITAFLAASTDYAKVICQISASKTGLDCVYLIAPEMGGRGGALQLVPCALGEALASFLRHELCPGWTSSDGISLRVHAVT